MNLVETAHDGSNDDLGREVLLQFSDASKPVFGGLFGDQLNVQERTLAWSINGSTGCPSDNSGGYVGHEILD